MSQRQAILDLLANQRTDHHQPAFSGLIHITAEGLQSEGLTFHEIHRDAAKMARASASTFRLSGLPSAVAPLDMCVEAEALGAAIGFAEGRDFIFPQVARPLFGSTTYLSQASFESTDFLERGRIPLVCQALRFLKAEVGEQAVIGGMLPGPYTLLLFLVEPGGLFAEMKREPAAVKEALSHLAGFLAQVGNAYHAAGADFLTVHDMGGSPGFLGPSRYEQFVYPAEKQLIAALPAPRVLSVCGKTDSSTRLLGETGAEAIAIDQASDLVSTRATLFDKLVFGNLDPVATLWHSAPGQVAAAAENARQAGVDAVWPGCDLVPQTRTENVRAMMSSA